MLKALSQRWATLETLVADLSAQGFGVDVLAQGHESPKAWSCLQHPRSSENPPEDAEKSYCYANDLKLLAKAPWGLILLDTKAGPVDASRLPKNAGPVLRMTAADAAMDHIVRGLAEPEWSGDSHPVPAGVRAEAGVVIGPGCEIGAGTVLETGVRLGARVRIGRDCRIGAHSRLSDDTVMGDRCRVTGFASIGGQGFGFVKGPKDATQRPRLHVGSVEIGSDVRLGAYFSVDRGVFEVTRIGDRCAFDNHVQIGHNCTMGTDNLIVTFSGLSGSVQTGNRVVIGGHVGTANRIHIGDDVTIAAQSGVSKDVPAGETVKGYPPRPLAEALKIQVLVQKLPQLFDRLRALETQNGAAQAAPRKADPS